MLDAWRRSLKIARLGLAARKIRQAKTDAQKEAAERELASQMASARGIPMKMGQIFASMDDDNEFRALTQSVQPWPKKEIVKVLEKAWQRPLSEVLSEFEESVAAASLGQVHRARLLDGRVVAIKVQYPDIAAAVESELKLAGLLPGMGPVKRWGFDLDGYKSTLKENMERELDYRSEAARQQVFAATMGVEGLSVPDVIEELSGTGVLVQSWVEGERLAQVRDWPLVARLGVARTLISTLCQSLFQHGMVHGDPHAGNLLFENTNEAPRVYLLDYGCMVEVDKSRRLALLKLILSARGEDSVDVLDGFAALGFDAEKLANIGDDLPKLLPRLFKPFIESRPFDASAWHLGADIAAILEERRWWFRAAGPPDLVLLMRVFQGLVQQLEMLDVRLPFWPLLTQSIPSTLIDEAKAWTPPSSGFSGLHSLEGASTLWVQIANAAEEKNRFSFPAHEALNLRTLIPEDIARVIAAEGVDLAEIQEQVKQRGLVPQVLFSVRVEETSYEVWLQ